MAGLSCYRNATPEETHSAASAGTDYTACVIGAQNTSAAAPFVGAIAAIAFYKVTITLAQTTALVAAMAAL